MRALAIAAMSICLAACGDEASSGDVSEELGVVNDAVALAEPDPADNLTGPQKNARRNAESYLSMAGFSRQGLIDQLSSDYGNGYSVADATAAVDSMTVDWNEQAARSAQSYLNMTGFSCKGLIDQLSSDAGNKYTREQAEYGARQAGAC